MWKIKIRYSCSLYFNVSLFESLVSEQMYPEFQSMYITLSFFTATQNTTYADSPGQWVIVTLMPVRAADKWMCEAEIQLHLCHYFCDSVDSA